MFLKETVSQPTLVGKDCSLTLVKETMSQPQTARVDWLNRQTFDLLIPKISTFWMSNE